MSVATDMVEGIVGSVLGVYVSAIGVIAVILLGAYMIFLIYKTIKSGKANVEETAKGVEQLFNAYNDVKRGFSLDKLQSSTRNSFAR